MKNVASSHAMAETMKNTTKVMAKTNKAVDVQKLQQTMQEFEKQNAVMDMTEEMMNDTMDNVLDDENDEEEGEEILAQVMDEIGIEFSTKAAAVPKGRLPTQAQQEEEDNIEARMSALKQ